MKPPWGEGGWVGGNQWVETIEETSRVGVGGVPTDSTEWHSF